MLALTLYTIYPLPSLKGGATGFVINFPSCEGENKTSVSSTRSSSGVTRWLVVGVLVFGEPEGWFVRAITMGKWRCYATPRTQLTLNLTCNCKSESQQTSLNGNAE